jgi:hypothetical protein
MCIVTLTILPISFVCLPLKYKPHTRTYLSLSLDTERQSERKCQSHRANTKTVHIVNTKRLFFVPTECSFLQTALFAVLYSTRNC